MTIAVLVAPSLPVSPERRPRQPLDRGNPLAEVASPLTNQQSLNKDAGSLPRTYNLHRFHVSDLLPAPNRQRLGSHRIKTPRFPFGKRPIFVTDTHLDNHTITITIMFRTTARVSPSIRTLVRALTRTSTTRALSTTLSRRMPSSLPPVTPPISERFPSDSFHLLSEAEKPGSHEDALYDQQLKDVEAWWATPRFEGIKRPYTVEDVVSKRGSLQQSYPCSVMARKLWNLIQERLSKGEPLHTSTFSSSYEIPVTNIPQWAPSTPSK